MAKIYPMGLIFGSLFMLMLPGMIYNNFVNSGLNPTFSLACQGPFAPNVAPDYTCQNSNLSGCQSTPAACKLSGSSISFLNSQSPFTQMLSGNIFGLFSSLTSNGNGNRGPFDANGGGPYYTADCYVIGVASGAQRNITSNSFASLINACTATNPDGSNMTKYACGATQTCFSLSQTTTFLPFTWGDWNFNQLGATSPTNIPFFHIWNNATYALTCYNQGYWFLTSTPSIGYATEGCDYYKAAGYTPPQNPNVNPVYSFLIGVPCSLGQNGCKSQTFPTGNNHMRVFVQPENWDTQFCTNTFGTPVSQNQYNWYHSQQCQNMETWFVSPHAGANFNLGPFTPLLTILLGIVLFLIGTGIHVAAGGQVLGTGTQVEVGTNRQGTKLAQVMGVALVVWSFLYSQFSTWFTSGVLPYGFDGTLGIIALAITAMFWAGTIWQATWA